MFGKHGRLERKLRETGTSAPAEVVAARPGHAIEHGDPVVPGNVELEWKLDLRVMPPGGQAFEASVTTRSAAVQGQQVTVLYDPDDHRSIVVDTKAQEDDRQALIRAKQAAAEARRTGSPAAVLGVPSAEGDRVDQLTKLAALHQSGALTDDEFDAEKKRILHGPD